MREPHLVPRLHLPLVLETPEVSQTQVTFDEVQAAHRLLAIVEETVDVIEYDDRLRPCARARTRR